MPTAAKKVPAPCPFVAEPMLLIFKEKHGDRYFHVPNDKTLFRVALYVLTERYKQGYWYPKPSDQDKPTPPDINEAGIAKLPQSLQGTAKKNLQEYKRALAEYTDLVSEYEGIKKTVDTENGRAAWILLRNRRDAEYEGFDLETYEEVE
jgi:hypothetical protein